MENSKPLGASRLVLPMGYWPTVFAYLCQRFAHIARPVWQQRFAQQKVLDQHFAPLTADTAYQPGAVVYYFRELAHESKVPFQEQILFEDKHVLVVDKPHFLTTAPVGAYVEETLLRRLQRRFQLPDLVPAHRLDRLTAGVLVLIKQPQDRDPYQRLFREKKVTKVYEAIAPALPAIHFPHIRNSRLQAHPEHFFLMQEAAGIANSQTRIEVLRRSGDHWLYALYPTTGRKHQLRVHMAVLGAPISGDRFYPVPEPQQQDDYAHPLQLLARRLSFVDPVTKQQRCFVSRRRLWGTDSLLAHSCALK